MKDFDFPAGTSLEYAAKTMAAHAIQHGSAKTTFNGIILIADKDSSPQSIMDDYRVQLDARSEAYRKSPEGIEAARKRTAEIARKQQLFDELMHRLPDLDFSNQEQLLDWFCELETTMDTGVRHDGYHATVVDTFAQNGYYPNVNTGSDNNPEDRDNVARYIIGQCLAMDIVHQVVHHFADEWKKKFCAPA